MVRRCGMKSRRRNPRKFVRSFGLSNNRYTFGLDTLLSLMVACLLEVTAVAPAADAAHASSMTVTQPAAPDAVWPVLFLLGIILAASFLQSIRKRLPDGPDQPPDVHSEPDSPYLDQIEQLERQFKTDQKQIATLEAYKQAFDVNQAPLLVIDQKTRSILGVNQTAQQLYGYSQQEFLSIKLSDLEVEENGSAPSSQCRKAEKHRTKKGDLRYVRVLSQPIGFQGAAATLLTVFDVTEHQKAAAAWDQERSLMRSLMDQLPVFIYAKDRESRFVFANKTVADSKGEKSPEDMIGKSDFDYYPADLAAEYRATEDEIMSSGRGMSDLEVYEKDKSGKESWSLNARVPWVDPSGQVVGILGVNRDITERKRVEAALEESRASFDSLFNSLPQSIYCQEKDGRISFANTAFCRTVNKPLSDISGKTAFSVFTADVASQHAAVDVRVLGGETVETVETHQAPTGRKAYNQVVKTPKVDSKGNVVGLQAIFWDITERKESEEALEASLAELQSIVTAVSEGDLTIRAVEGHTTLGQMAQSVNKMLDNFNKTIIRVRELSLSVASSATQMLAAGEQIAAGSLRQTQEITDTSSSVEEMAASMGQVSKNAENTADAARRTLDVARHGESAARDAFEAMSRINVAVQSTASSMRALAERSTQISEILGFISNIAAQTNLLSLNAAIQAAHAGDAGVGFSVVAEEIRSLAEKSAQSTKEINKIIKAMQGETKDVLSSMDSVLAEVKGGGQLAEVAGHSIQDISRMMTESAELIEEISAAAGEQARVSSSIAGAMQTVSSIAIETSAGAQQTSNILNGLVSKAEHLTDSVLRFKVDRA